jgi:uncharacterized protein
MPFDRDFEALPVEECRRLLADRQLGRIGLSVGALPVVLPVNYVVDGERVVVRTGAGSKLAAAMRGAVVCVEIDEVDADARTGWSVLVTGVASEVTGAEAERLSDLLDPWSPSAGEHVIAITIELVSGRRIAVPAAVS